VGAGDARTTSGSGGLVSARHFTGSNTRWVVAYLRNHMPHGTLEAVLADAGEKRSPDVLSDEATWSTYDQFRRLLEATADALGGLPELRAIGLHSFESLAIPDYTELLQALGSPAALYAELPTTTTAIYTIVEVESEEAGPTEWMVRYRMTDGCAPFKAFCWYVSGLFGVTPRLFGFPPAEIIEESCACEGGSECVFRIRWEATEEPVRRAEYWETRSMVLEARLNALQRTVIDLVSAGSLPTVLSRIVSSAARAVQAPCFVLALESLPSTAQRVYGEGLDDDHAARVAGELLGDGASPDASRLVVDVHSATRRYGRLAAIKPDGGRFLPQERSVLEAYASLAAAALDSATALEEARALLELSTSLAQVVSTEEMAAKLAHAVPAVIGCDAAVVALVDPGTTTGRVAAGAGFSAAIESQLQGIVFPLRLGVAAAEAVMHWSEEEPGTALLAEIFRLSGIVAIASLAILCDGEVVGHISAGVRDHPDRLRESRDIERRMRGLAGQAATAITNARLLDRVRHQAMHDDLTGLANRVLILDRAEQMLARARREHVPMAALFIDLDNFKNVNDTLGHQVGDELLRAVANRLAAALRGADTVGRLGGDEFVVLAEGVSLAAGAELLAERIHDVLSEPFTVASSGAAPLLVSASIGIANGAAASVGDLLRAADIALYRAKAAGKGCHVSFEPAMQSEVIRRLALEMDVRSMLPDQLFVVYQPVFDLTSLRITGVEALLRWRHPTRGIVSPAEFIPLLEETGNIFEVGRWVLSQACAAVATWREAGSDLYASINVSMRQLESDRLVHDVRDALASTGLEPNAVMLEVTETALMVDTDATIRRLTELKALGVRLAIDDFGTGYSSLAYLKQFPVDALKIDRSFIAGMSDSPGSLAIIHTLVELGRTLGLETIAEGIETDSQLAELQHHQCGSGQGFLMGVPLEADKLEALLQRTVPGAV
jgi:diguanylate cyclase (GGDEF)-like protein